MRSIPLIEWNPEEIKKWINECVDVGGLPQFRTRGYGRPIYDEKNRRIVYGICLSPRKDKPNSIKIFNVPKHIVELMERTTGEWRILLSDE